MFKKIKDYLTEYSIEILSVICIILLLVFISLSIFVLDELKEHKTNNTVELCSMTTDNNIEDYNKTYSDYISLSAPIVKIGSSNYRCVGSIFLGYEGDNVYLYYPVAYTDSYNNRAYEYRRQSCEYGYLYNINLAVQSIQVSATPINVSYRFDVNRGEHFTTLIKQDIYETDFFDHHCFIDDVSSLDSTLNGYATFNDYYCWGGLGDYRYRLRVYNVGNLLEEPNTYNITDRYNPCLHFNDFSGYNNGYDNGYAIGYGNGENAGIEYGQQVGYDKGYSDGVTSDGLFGFLSGSVENLMEIELFPQFSIGDALWIGIGIVLFGVFMKIFRF